MKTADKLSTKLFLTFALLALAAAWELCPTRARAQTSQTAGGTKAAISLPASAPGETSQLSPAQQKAYECPEWFRDAKFGIWSHWGPSSVPGLGNEYPKDMYQQGSKSYQWHLEHFGHPSEAGYKEVIQSWKAEKFDPEALIKKYQAAGAKYLVALATHHDNFDCFDSSAHEWNSVKVGPKKDIVGLWRRAALKNGMHFGVSSHADGRGWNYFYNSRGADATGPKAGIAYDGANPTNESLYNHPQGPKDAPPSAWLDKWLKRHIDLVDNYQPELLYFDGGVPHGEYGARLVAHYLEANRQQHGGCLEAVVCTKSEEYVRDYERGAATIIREKPWQDDTSLGGWFFLNDPIADHHSRSKNAATVIHTLADVVSKNGNLLLNMPQRGDGSLYPECEGVLEELAKWVPINGEAIFGTRPWTTFGEGPSALPKASYMNELKQPLTAEDVRFTTKGAVLYAIVLGVPNREVRIQSLGRLGSKVASVELLGSKEKLKWKQEWEGLVIQPVSQWPCAHAITFKVLFGK